MAKSTPKTNNLRELRAKLVEMRLSIRSHQEKNTNAHKALKKQIAQELTKLALNK